MHASALIPELRQELVRRFRVRPDEVRVLGSPYRICPLGAHIDHQLGIVTGMAIDRGTWLVYAPSPSAEVRLASRSFPGEVAFAVDRAPERRCGDWGDYARGAARALAAQTPLARGFVGLTHGELMEAGLSSSASIGVAYLLALEDVNGLRVSAVDNIRFDQAIENGYLGLNNGILDQATILCSQRDHLTVIDCLAFAHGSAADAAQAIQRIPPGADLPPFAILIADSGITEPIIATGYNRRVEECAAAAQILLEAAGRREAKPRLGQVSFDEYARFQERLSGAAALRARHFFTETIRVHHGIEAWRRGDLVRFGRLMTESGRSSIDNYQCGCEPLQDLFELLVKTPGIHGARFSGAGFRGCCIALADPVAAEEALPELQRAYAQRQPGHARRSRFLVCRGADGAGLL